MENFRMCLYERVDGCKLVRDEKRNDRVDQGIRKHVWSA